MLFRVFGPAFGRSDGWTFDEARDAVAETGGGDEGHRRGDEGATSDHG
jgi:hypothetical protein